MVVIECNYSNFTKFCGGGVSKLHRQFFCNYAGHCMAKLKSDGSDYIEKSKAKKPYMRPRNVNLSMKITQEERDMIERRMAQAGMTAIRAYVVKMAIDGRVIHVELDSVREMVRLLSNATNNINQIARKANETGNIYAKDIEALQDEVESIWGQTQVILQKINKL